MSTASHESAADKREHGTTRSYVIGFILSLIFTIIPYYLVVNKVLMGSTLMAVILGIAVLQMFIQIFFFLHLGRGPKPFYNVIFFFATAGLIVMVVGASILIMNSLYRNMSPEEVTTRLSQEEGIAQIGGKKTGACQVTRASHLVTVSAGTVSPVVTDAQLCDSLTFINEDDKPLQIAFGSHPQDESYGGVYEITVRKGRPETITLNEAGAFEFHDHLGSPTAGYFSVSE
jgi:cytochrome o ubiquinol oxidase operon protein cyoD